MLDGGVSFPFASIETILKYLFERSARMIPTDVSVFGTIIELVIFDSDPPQ
jgi:hypothetical protein